MKRPDPYTLVVWLVATVVGFLVSVWYVDRSDRPSVAESSTGCRP